MSLDNNPLINPPQHKHDTPSFTDIKLEHFMPAFDYAIDLAKKELTAIEKNPDKADFDNTILAMENCSELLDSISSIYFNLTGAESDNDFKELAQEISPKLSEFGNSIHLNEQLFERVKEVYNNRDSGQLTDEQKRLVSEEYKSFIRGGITLNDEDKEKFKKISEELSKLSPQFSQNTLNATNAFSYHTENEDEIVGLPQMAINMASNLAKENGQTKGWTFNLQMPSYIPVVTYGSCRSLRERMTRARSQLSASGTYDNRENVKRIATLRYNKARLLGFKDHADYILQNRMAGSTKNVMSFIENLYTVYHKAAQKELEEIKTIARKDGIEDIKPWDIAYYSEKLKKEKFDFDQEELRPYFKVENVIEGVFKVAHLMYGITFEENNDIPVYHKEVRIFEVYDINGSYLALLYIDLHPRETKKGGAWMTQWRSQGLYNGKIGRPLVSIVCNLTPSTAGKPSLLSYNEVNTLFHEFGHALHGIFSNVTYRSLSGTNVYWDFVELPSQIMENWIGEKEALDLFAVHHKTGEKLPNELITKIKKTSAFNAGLTGLRQISLSLLDMAWHSGDPSTITDVIEFENQALAKTQLLKKIDGDNISCSFSHIFSGGYSAGYYSYKWAEVLDADAFELFKEKGVFNKETAQSFRDTILSKGNTEPPMDIYVKFRGKQPDPDAPLRREQLI